MPSGRRKWIRANIGAFLQQYQRKAQRGVEPNDRHYDRDLEAKLKRMKPEDLSRLMSEDDDSEHDEDVQSWTVVKVRHPKRT